ncbi:MAG: GrpB family protein [Roseibium sp.]
MKVELSEYQRHWRSAFDYEADLIKELLGKNLREIHHIGSTSVPGLLAKPIIDMLGGVTSLEECDAASDALARLGYIAMGEYGIPGRLFFRKTAQDGNRSHHLHVFEFGSPDILRHLVFRDYLIAHPDIASAYADKKRKLVQDHDGDRDGYVDGKQEFAADIEKTALEWYNEKRRLISSAPIAEA